MEPRIKVESEDSEKIINIPIPEKTNDVTPNKFSFRDDGSDATESIKDTREAEEPNNVKDEFNYDMYANPKKKIKSEDEYTEDDDEEGTDDDETEDSDEDGSDNDSRKSLVKEPRKPSMTRLEEKIKKKDMLIKLHEAEQNGYTLLGKYNVDSDLEEMEAEYQLYEKKMEENSLIDFFQDVLMAIIKGIEVLNGIYNPLNIKLNGFSEKVYDRKDKIDHVLRRLAVKYSGGTEMPPELSLLFIIGGAMFMTHLGNTALENGPALLDKLMGSGVLDKMAGMFNNVVPQNAPSNFQRKENTSMKAPANDLSNLMNSFKTTDKRDDLPFEAMNVPSPMPFPKSTSKKDVKFEKNNSRFVDDSDRFSVESSEPDETIDISIPSKKSQKRSIEIV
jgi:hypothetical protein